MSAVKFQQPLYKAFEPNFPSQRPIIVDGDVESPEAVTLRYEEEAARANGGSLRGQTPPDLLPMAAYKAPQTQLHSFADAAFQSYGPQSFPTQQPDNAVPQLGSLAFGANGTASQYLSAGANPTPVNIISCHPMAGNAGTRVELKVTSQYDLTAMSTPAPYVWLSFGSQKCHAEVVKEAVTQDGLSYVVSAEAPQFLVTNCPSQGNVPLTVVIENGNGEELARVPVAQSFAYQDVSGSSVPTMEGAAGDTVTTAAPEDTTRKSPLQSPGHGENTPQLTVRTSTTNSPSQANNPLSADSNTNTFSYPPTTVDAASAAAAAAVANTSYSQDNGNMLGAYRSASFSDGFPRAAAPPSLRSSAGSSAWNTYGGGIGLHHHDRYGGIGRSHSISHVHSTASITRPSHSATLPAPSHGSVPQLIRTSTIQSGSLGSGVGGYGNGAWGGYTPKAVLSIMGNLDAMAQDWTPEEWTNRRRIVLFRKKQNGCHLEATFRAVPINERPPNSICISCIYWAEKQECFVTSVDTINLLEQLVASPARFSVEEKNRIRRNLEGFKPFTVSKAKAESEEFFKLIMAFGAPKPRTIEKDVKVFPWKVLGQALKKIISKYSASPASILSPTTSTTVSNHHMLTPVSMSPSYPGLPHAPGSVTAPTDAPSSVGYVTVANGTNPPDTLATPRSMSGASWVSYPGGPSGRALSPGSTMSKPQSPSAVGIRMNTLSAAYDSRGSINTAHANSPATHSYGHHPHHTTHNFNSPLPITAAAATQPPPATAATSSSHGAHSGSRWDGYDVGANAGQSYPSSHHHQHTQHGQLYGAGYGDNAQRA